MVTWIVGGAYIWMTVTSERGDKLMCIYMHLLCTEDHKMYIWKLNISSKLKCVKSSRMFSFMKITNINIDQYYSTFFSQTHRGHSSKIICFAWKMVSKTPSQQNGRNVTRMEIHLQKKFVNTGLKMFTCRYIQDIY